MAPAGNNLPAAADTDLQGTVSTAAENWSPDQTHENPGQPNTESLDFKQPSASAQASGIESLDGASNVQPGPSDSLNKDSLEASDEEHLLSHPQSSVSGASPSLTASQLPVQYSPQVLKSSAPSSLASSPMQSPRPRSAASEADSVQDPVSPSAVAAASLLSSRAQSPSMQNRSSQSSPGQQAYETRLRSALSPAAKTPLQSQAAAQSNGVTLSPPRAPASRPSSAAASPPASAMSDLIAAMSDSRPSSASPASQSACLSPQSSASLASAASSRPASAGSQPQQPNGHAADVPVSGTATPARSAADFVPQSPRPGSAAPSQASPARSPRVSSAAEQAAQAAMAAITGLPPAPAAHHKALPAAIKAVSAGLEPEAPSSPPEESAVPTSPPVTTPVRKPPGLPSPVTHLSGHNSPDVEAAALSSGGWPDQVSSNSEATSNPHSPSKAAMASHSAHPTQPSSLPAAPWSGVLSESASDDGSQGSQLTGNEQPLDMSNTAIAARLAKEERQQREQEAKHLVSKERAAKRRAKELSDRIAEQDRRQQAEHAARAEVKARQRREKAEKEAQAGRPVAGPFQATSSGRGEPRAPKGAAYRDEHREYGDGPPQQAPKSYPAQGIKPVPAHGVPRHPSTDRRTGRQSVYNAGSGSEYEHSQGPGSDYGDASEDYGFAPVRGGHAGRGRGAAARGRGARGPSPQGEQPLYACVSAVWSEACSFDCCPACHVLHTREWHSDT